MAKTWTVHEIAAASGRSRSVVSTAARRLLPEYAPPIGRAGAQIPDEWARAVVTLLRSYISPQVVDLVRSDPEGAAQMAEALTTLAQAHATTTTPEGEAA